MTREGIKQLDAVMAQADHVIRNDGTLAAFEARILELLEEIEAVGVER